MSAKSKTLFVGIRDTIPFLIGIAPFGLITGAVHVGTGMPEWAATFFSLFVFAGASQLAANHLMAEHAPTVVVIFTGLIINLRMVMYSASLSSHIKGGGLLRKSVLAYLLTDQAFAMSISRFNRADAERLDKVAYYLGAAIACWCCFCGFVVIGAHVGTFIPEQWDLEFAIPLTFLALVVPAVKDRPCAFAAGAAALVSVLAMSLPFNLGLMAGAISGIAIGYFTEWRAGRG